MNWKKYLTYYGLSGYFSFGFSLILVGTLIPVIEQNYGINHSLIGFALSMGAIAFLLASLFYGYILEKFKAFYVIMLAILIFNIGNFALLLMDSFLYFIVGYIFLNFGGGAIEISIPFLIGVYSEGKKAKELNILHSAFAIGAVLSPVLSSLILKYSSFWKFSFLVSFIFSLLPLAFFLKLKNNINKVHGMYLKEKKSLKKSLDLTLLVLILALSFYVGYEMNFSSWISAFLHEVRNFEVSKSAVFPSFLWIGLFLGRTLFSTYPEKIGYRKWLLFVVSMSLLFSTLSLFFTKTFINAAILTVLTGFSFATTYPTIQAMIVEKYKKNKGIALSLASASTSLFSGLASYIIGYIGTIYGLLYGFLVVLILNIVEILLITISK